MTNGPKPLKILMLERFSSEQLIPSDPKALLSGFGWNGTKKNDPKPLKTLMLNRVPAERTRSSDREPVQIQGDEQFGVGPDMYGHCKILESTLE